MKEAFYPPRLTSEEGIAEVIREAELNNWQYTFRGSDKLTPALLGRHAREIADWRIDELREEYGSLTGAFNTDSILRDQLTVFEKGRIFLNKVVAPTG